MACRVEPGWYNAGYIFPPGFKSRVNFRSSLELDQLCVHECSVVGKGGQFWPAPTFIVVAMDRPNEPLVAKSCTGCWTGVRHKLSPQNRLFFGSRSRSIPSKICHACSMEASFAQVLKRINAEIDARRKAGEDLPPPPKTAIAGPEYFGFNQGEVSLLSLQQAAAADAVVLRGLRGGRLFEETGACRSRTRSRRSMLSTHAQSIGKASRTA